MAWRAPVINRQKLSPLSYQSVNGEPEVIAESVLSFDVNAQQEIVYTNGSGIYTLKPGGVPQRLHTSRMIRTGYDDDLATSL